MKCQALIGVEEFRVMKDPITLVLRKRRLLGMDPIRPGSTLGISDFKALIPVLRLRSEEPPTLMELWIAVQVAV